MSILGNPLTRLELAQCEVNGILAESATLAEALPRILKAMCQTLGWDFGQVWRIDAAAAAAGVLRCLAQWNDQGPELAELEAMAQKTTFAPGVGLPGRVWDSGQHAWIPDIVHDMDSLLVPSTLHARLHGMCIFPIRSGNRIAGVIGFISLQVRPLDESAVKMMSVIASQIGQFMERRQAEDNLNQFFDLSLDMLVMAGFDGYFKRVSASWKKTFGWTREELTASPYLDFVHPDDLQATLAAAHSLSDDGTNVMSFENRYRCKDGSYKWLSWNAVPLDQKQMIYCVARDMTEQKRTEEALRRAKEAAEAAGRAKGDFLANMSHEIRTPLNAVIGMTELVLDTSLSSVQREYLSTVKAAGDSLLTLLNDILDFSKIEAGMLNIERIELNLRDSIGDTVQTLATRAHGKGLELACQVQSDVPETLVGDPGRLRQLLVNLVGNAIKFTDRGEVVIRVEMGPRTADEVCLHFAVTDTGVGIPAAKHQSIFGAFVQADGSTTRKYGGTGLGLTISSQLVNLMGGKIWVESEVGLGSTFYFTVPFGLKQAPVQVAMADVLDLPVLVVDDNATNRRILEEVLANWHMRPTAVDSAQSALSAMQRARDAGTPFAIVLTDVNMPGMDGFTLVEQIRRTPDLAGAIIMMLTSADRIGDAARCHDLGVKRYLMKPVKQSDLLDAITAALSASPIEDKPADLATAPSPALNRRRLRILTAEDNLLNQRLTTCVLEKMGHTVTIADDGMAALAAMEKQPFDLVMMDIQMPNMDGLEATAAIREREAATGAHIPIIAMTAHAMKGDKERCLSGGMDDYLAKPLRAEDLLRAVERWFPAAPVAGQRAPSPAGGEGHKEGSIDPQDIVSRVDGDSELLHELVGLFLDSYPAKLAEIREAVARRDPRALERAAHALKGSVSTFGASAAFEIALRLETLALEGDLTLAEAVFAELKAEIERLTHALAAMVEKGAS